MDRPIQAITLGDVQEFRHHLESGRELATATASRKLATIKSLFTFAHKIGYVQFNTGRPIRQPTPRRRLAEKLLTAGEGSEGALSERGQVTVFGKGDKERAVLLSASAWKVLSELRRQERVEGRGGAEDPLFWSREGGALTGTQIYNVVQKAARRAGIEKPVSPHSFRHAHLSHALARGATIEEARETAGHNSIQTTSVYVHARPDSSTSDYLPE